MADPKHGWAHSESSILEYFLNIAKIQVSRTYFFHFEDGTGYIGKPVGAATYILRRFTKYPNSSFEIEELEGSAREGEVLPPEFEGQFFEGDRKDPRF